MHPRLADVMTDNGGDSLILRELLDAATESAVHERGRRRGAREANMTSIRANESFAQGARRRLYPPRAHPLAARLLIKCCMQVRSVGRPLPAVIAGEPDGSSLAKERVSIGPSSFEHPFVCPLPGRGDTGIARGPK